MKIPQEVKSWVKTHAGYREPEYSPNCFEIFKNSRSVSCWGNNGSIVGNYEIAVCQPTPVGGKGFFFFDFKKISK